jgi:hypothetical protein
MASAVQSGSELHPLQNAGARAIMTKPRGPFLEISLDLQAQEILDVGSRDMLSVWLDYAQPDDDHPVSSMNSESASPRSRISSIDSIPRRFSDWRSARRWQRGLSDCSLRVEKGGCRTRDTRVAASKKYDRGTWNLAFRGQVHGADDQRVRRVGAMRRGYVG